MQISKDMEVSEMNANKNSLQLNVLRQLIFLLNTNVKMSDVHHFIKSPLQQYILYLYQNVNDELVLWKLCNGMGGGLVFVYNDHNALYDNLLRKTHITSVFTVWQQNAFNKIYKGLNVVYCPNICNAH